MGNMKKFILGMLLTMLTLTSYGKCDWSNYTMSVYYQIVSGQRVYHSSAKYLGNDIWGDSCVKVQYSIYDHESKKLSGGLGSYLTLYPSGFNHNRYTIYCKLLNICQNCDTTYSYTIEVKNFNKYCFFEEKKACGKYLYEMCLIPNTDTSCKYNYYFSIWGGSSLDKINQKQWDTLSAQYLGSMYNYPSADLVTQQKGGGFVYQYPKNGRYLLVKQVISCLSDTTTFEKVTIDCLAGIEDLQKPEPKLIGTYDMLGRPVDKVEDNIPYIFLYDNGQRKKIIKVK